MTKVDFFSKEVKYSGSIKDYTLDELLKMAQHAALMCDAWDESKDMIDEEAKALDGKSWIKEDYPCNHLAVIAWSYIAEEGDDE